MSQTRPSITVQDVTCAGTGAGAGDGAGNGDLAAVQGLCRDFMAWVRERYADRPWLVDSHYPPEKWETLVQSLPHLHAPPGGLMLLCRMDGAPAGCVMLNRADLDGETGSPAGDGQPCEGASERACEMKRLFVAGKARGQGIARLLCRTLIGRARDIGYRRMVLETGVLQTEAVSLYESLGFRRRAPYHAFPDAVHEQMVVMERLLADP